MTTNKNTNTDTNQRITANGKTQEKVLHPKLSYEIVGACYDVHNELGRFAREKQYGDLLNGRFDERGLNYKREFALGDSGNIVDFLVEDKVLLELKTVRFLMRSHFRQLQNYLQRACLDLGLLINFSDEVLQPKRIIRIDVDSKKFVDSKHS